MKKITTLGIFFLFLTFSYSQKNPEKIFITNDKNFEKSIFSKIELQKENITKTLIGKLGDFGRYDFVSKLEAKLVGLPNKFYGTGLGFYFCKNKSKIYYYPISEHFMENGFSKIYLRLQEAQKIKIRYTVYKTDANPIVIIDRIKVLD